MKRWIAGVISALLVLSGCGHDAVTLLQTETCTVTQRGSTIDVYCAETDETYHLKRRKAQHIAGIVCPARVLVDNASICICACRNELWITDYAAGHTYVIRL